MDSKEAMKLALEALKLSSVTVDSFGVQGKTREAITALREALAEQPAQHEPVAWAISYDGKTPYFLWTDGDGVFLDLEVKRQGGTTCKLPLYTAPPAQRTWVGLTLEDMETIHWSPDFRAGAKWAAAKLKEKNT